MQRLKKLKKTQVSPSIYIKDSMVGTYGVQPNWWQKSQCEHLSLKLQEAQEEKFSVNGQKHYSTSPKITWTSKVLYFWQYLAHVRETFQIQNLRVYSSSMNKNLTTSNHPVVNSLQENQVPCWKHIPSAQLAQITPMFINWNYLCL